MTDRTAEALELKAYGKRLAVVPDGESTLYLLEAIELPDGCSPSVSDALLCPTARDGYPSRLYFPEVVGCRFSRNWNFDGVIAGKRWRSFSWKVEPASLTLAQILLGHLEAFTRC